MQEGWRHRGSLSIALGANERRLEPRLDRCIRRRRDERVGATDENLRWHLRQTAEECCHHGGIDAAAEIALAARPIARQRQSEIETVIPPLQREKLVAEDEIVQAPCGEEQQRRHCRALRRAVADHRHERHDTELHAATVVGYTVGDPFKDTSSVAMNPVIKFTTLFGLLAVELAIELPPLTSHVAAEILFLASNVFVYRSFYGMRIPVVATK